MVTFVFLTAAAARKLLTVQWRSRHVNGKNRPSSLRSCLHRQFSYERKTHTKTIEFVVTGIFPSAV